MTNRDLSDDRASSTPVFLRRESYRRRRLVDAARFLPFLVAALWLIPLLWLNPANPTYTTSQAILYVFGVWLVALTVSGVLSVALHREYGEPPADQEPPTYDNEFQSPQTREDRG